jgi:YHS domain-containing protein
MIPRPSRLGRASSGLIFMLPLLCAGLVAAGERDPIAWRDNYNQALLEAKSANRLLWVQFTGPWCPNCARMERESFPSPPIIQHARDSFVPVKLQSDVHEQLALEFNLSALPATVIVAPDRVVVAVHQGFLDSGEFDAFLRDSLARRPEVRGREARAQEPKRSSENVREGGEDSVPLALDGYCVVSLVRDRKLVAGANRYRVQYDGRNYRFANREQSEQFRAAPEAFVPANNGACPVSQVERGKSLPGRAQWGILYNSRLFLFASDDDRIRFRNDPDRYAMVDVAERGFCLHCIRENGLLVRGDPRHELARAGRRYWFPDASHRDAFLTTLR